MLLRVSAPVTVTTAPPPGAFARMVELQSAWYAEHHGFGLPFESMLASDVGEYTAALPHPDCRSWVALADRQVTGCITIDGRGRPSARLRWFFIERATRGGLGRQMLENALGFCRDSGFGDVWLTTFNKLLIARHLYETQGFRLEQEELDTTWGVPVREQVFRLHLR
ncbi:MAG TPA: GNAT family N-acetyltransferase [Falsiroseomonas sp.]|jgi:GNAT superfamily N-acetyltransferase|nr:GNAT family N-acetyltransferase [Falsiroseomonas sp.]